MVGVIYHLSGFLHHKIHKVAAVLKISIQENIFDEPDPNESMGVETLEEVFWQCCHNFASNRKKLNWKNFKISFLIGNLKF